MIESLLIANRGEIACRIIRTARKMGIRTIAVFSEADRNSLHVQMADQVIAIGGAAASESYLNPDLIVEAALSSGAQAIHPGYGFLSEQTALIRKCQEHDIIWIGPHEEAIRSMGSKIEAKQIAIAAGVPCIPGYSGEVQSDEAQIKAALKTGLPVMIKASAGGGGKGMRPVFEEADLPDAIATARTEAQRAFGDNRLLIEKLVQKPRHIEVQVLGDKQGNIIHLFERDCSVQRNHQKIIEECPAPNLDDATRLDLFEAALNLCRSIKYDNAGTVEFILDGTTGEFYFLEMNTRLQVEHTVTEEVTGLDLVEQQILIATGERLSLDQDKVKCAGHAIQARLTAEDPASDFAPDTGTICFWEPDDTIRCDTFMRQDAVISPYYDSLIGKFIAHGDDREQARLKLLRGLRNTNLAGVKTNRLFLQDILKSHRFSDGDINTDFLKLEWPAGWSPAQTRSFTYAALAQHLQPSTVATPWHNLDGFRLLHHAGQPAKTTYTDQLNRQTELVISQSPEDLVVHNQEGKEPVTCEWENPNRLIIQYKSERIPVGVAFEGNVVHVWGANFEGSHQVTILADYQKPEEQTGIAQDNRIIAPMPGLVVEVRVSPGSIVSKGEILMTMESMKLLIELKSNAEGSVCDVAVQPGDVVEQGALLIMVEPAEVSETIG